MSLNEYGQEEDTRLGEPNWQAEAVIILILVTMIAVWIWPWLAND